MRSSSGGFGSADWHRQEPGCPNECLKLWADVVHMRVSLGITEEEDLLTFPPSLPCLEYQLMLSDTQMLLTSVLIDSWLHGGSEPCSAWCEGSGKPGVIHRLLTLCPLLFC